MSGPAPIPSARDVFFGPVLDQDTQRAREDLFFKSLRMPNWTHKETRAGRLVEFDELILGHLPQKDGLRILDVGVASGITTLDLARRLETAGRDFRITAVDQYLHARLVAVGSGMDVLFTHRGELLQVRVGNRVRPLPQGPVAWKRWLAYGVLGAAGLVARAWPGRGEPLNLVSREVQEHPGIEFSEQDIGQRRGEWAGQFDAIRAANILNLSYFPPEQLRAMVGYLTGYLKANGILAVCRTDEEMGITNGTLFRKGGGISGERGLDGTSGANADGESYNGGDGRLAEVAKIGQGTELRTIMENVEG